MLKTRTGRIALTVLLMLPTLALVSCAVAAAEAPASTPVSAPTSTASPQNEAADPVWPNERCQDEQLAAELVDRPYLSTTDQEGFAIVLTNASEQSCSYYGSPGVLLLDVDGALLTSRSGDTLGPAGSPGTTAEPTPGALAPGESVQVEGQLTVASAYDCTTVTTIRVLVTSDGAGPGVDIPTDLQVCGDARSSLAIGSYFPVS